MVRRTTRIALEILGAVLVTTTVVAAVLVWRLGQGPVDLDYLNPRIEQALSDLQAGMEVRIDRAQLTWDGWPERIALRAHEVEVTSEGEHVASLPSVDLDLSLSALMSGTLAPTGVAVRGARLTLVRDEQGLAFAGMEDQPYIDISLLLPVLIDDLMAEPDPAKPLSYLEWIRLSEVRTEVHDFLLDVTWQAPATDITLGRKPGGLTGEIQGPVMLGLSEVNLDAALDFDAASERTHVIANLHGLEPAALAEVSPAFEPLSGLRLPISGTVETNFDLGFSLGEFTANLQGGSGEISLPGLLSEALPVESLKAGIRADTTRGVVNLNDMRVDLQASDEGAPAPSLQAQARLTGLHDDMRVEALARAENITAEALPRYWPEQVLVSARSWVKENIRTGIAETATASLTTSIPDGDFAKLTIEKLQGEFRYEGLDVHYLRPLPPVREVEGTAAFDLESLRIFPTRGRLNDLVVDGAEIEITEFESTYAPKIDIRFAAAGPLRTTLELLDKPRLQLITPLGIDPSTTAGHAEALVDFSFPLRGDLRFEQVELGVDAQLSDVTAEGFLLEQDARAGRFDLQVDMNGMTLAGPVELGGVPLDLQWRESFASEPEFRGEVHAQIPAIEAEQFARLGFDVSPYLEGPLSANIAARSFDNGWHRILASANLQDTALAVPGSDWAKEPGEAAEARFDLRLQDGVPRILKRFDLDAGAARAGPLELGGRADFSGDEGDIGSLSLDSLRFRGSRLDSLHAERGELGWQIALGRGTLDLSPLLAGAASDDDDELEGYGGLDPETLPPFSLSAPELDRLVLGEGRHLENVALDLRRNTLGHWRRLHLAGTVPGVHSRVPLDEAEADGSAEAERPDPPATSFHFDYAPDADGRQTLRVEAEDTAAVLRAFNAYDALDGGQLRVEGISRGAGPESPIDARFALLDVRAVQAPILARLLTVASLTGIGERLGGEGIHFQSVTGDIVLHRDGVVTTDQLHAYGPSLGLTAEGRIDVPGQQMDLEGVVVPAASINRAVESIPLLGALLTGGTGEGIIAINYSLSGAMDDPDVSVNPLSALAPGFLRTLFGALGGQGGEGGRNEQFASPDGP